MNENSETSAAPRVDHSGQARDQPVDGLLGMLVGRRDGLHRDPRSLGHGGRNGAI